MTSTAQTPCPKCESTQVWPIEYGLVEPDEPTTGDVMLGGCLVERGVSPAWYCNNCGEKFGIWDPEEEDQD